MSQFSKSSYDLIAAAIRHTRLRHPDAHAVIDTIVDELAATFAADNGRFDPVRFMKATYPAGQEPTYALPLPLQQPLPVYTGPRCDICGAPADERYSDDQHRCFNHRMAGPDGLLLPGAVQLFGPDRQPAT